MSKMIDELIETEITLNRLRVWLQDEFQFTVEEFIILYKLFHTPMTTAKSMREDMFSDLNWTLSKINIHTRRLYKRDLITKERSESDERIVYYFLNDNQKTYTASLIKAFEKMAK